MKKTFALFLSFCIILTCMAMPVSATEYSNESCEILSETTFDGREFATFEVSVDNNGNTNIMPYNTDLAQINSGYWQNTVHVSRGKNMKVHVYISSYMYGCNSVDIYCKAGSPANTKSPQYKVARWTGTGHKYADLALNTQNTTYYVMLWGGFNGSGAVYTEP